jgi:pimeloyl-ACP methyl ester carboxylesterase
MKRWPVLFFCVAICAISSAQLPPPDAFRVLPPSKMEGPVISSYLKYQTERAWDQDDQRRKLWENIRTEGDLLNVQKQIHKQLLLMLGGLPTHRTPLRPRITGTIKMNGFHIEKVIYESLPGIYVPALVYVPDDGAKKHPATLVPSGHAAKGKMYYQALCQRLVQRGYIVIAWDPVGQGERSQFWDATARKSRYNLICAEHAVLGNLAFLAGTNLGRWEIWDGIRSIDYLLTRTDVDPERINITGSSGGGTQTAYIAALDGRIKVAAPSCYITALPMRVYNRIFKDPDSDPEQDLYGMISGKVDHPGLLLMMYPRPVFVAAAVLDFFPIEGTHKSFREVNALYTKFAHADHIAMREGYHEHQYSEENQEAALEFIDHFNGMPARPELAPVHELDEKTLQCTRTGQVMLDFEDARSLMDEIRSYYEEHKLEPHETLKTMYRSNQFRDVGAWTVKKYAGTAPAPSEISWQSLGTSRWEGVNIDRYLLRHSQYLEMPLLWIHKKNGEQHRPVLFWLSETGKATEKDWPQLSKLLAAGYNIVSFDPRGLGEDRMSYKAASPDDPALAQLDFDHGYVNPLSGVLADYVYNSILTGRPYFLEMIEDVEIAARFSRSELDRTQELTLTGSGSGYAVASSASEVLPGVKLLPQPDAQVVKWSGFVDQKRELWPIQFLLPGGAYIH